VGLVDVTSVSAQAQALRISCPASAAAFLEQHQEEFAAEFAIMKIEIAAPVIVSLVYRSYSHNSLTPLGIGAAAVTAIAHALHPWNVFFVLLVVFFLAGTAVTKVCCSWPEV
jgi:uncharacterized membrane protein